ncbi:tetratricopeptide repeat protein [Neobacillus drentensis]|uniref:tetratricopeptide repeat protein n=1 Tax=Neobacillus drentensis TaxID=220684 RepID=UPI003000A2D0
MSIGVDQLKDRAVSYKRAGNFEMAKNCYIEAIELEPSDMMTYIGLGKTAHLLKNQNLAVRSYLAATHIQLSPIEKAMNENNLPMHLKFQYDSFPKDLLASLPRKSAFTIFIDVNTPRHLAHSVIDLSASTMKENPQLVPYSEVYRAHILGNGTHERVLNRFGFTGNDQIETDENVYIPYGRKFVISELKWDKIHSNNVLDLYFN